MQSSQSSSDRYHGLIYQSRSMGRVVNLIQHTLDNDVPVLITGPTGAGKEVVAQTIHAASKRAAAPLMCQNCGAIQDTLLESELFGHARGAFTGALNHKPGIFEQANGGTVFLDEIGEASPAFQVRLLRFLETGKFRRVGETLDRRSDVRIIAATNRNLAAEMDHGRFREDLYFRLSVFPIPVPALEHRREDIPVLAEHFAKDFYTRHGQPYRPLSPAMIESLLHRPWPGNVRELKNQVQRLIVGYPNHLHQPATGPARAPGGADPIRTLAEVERDHIRLVLNAVNGNISKAANCLGLNRSTFRSRLKKLGMQAQPV